jgi:hypothetical protein
MVGCSQFEHRTYRRGSARDRGIEEKAAKLRTNGSLRQLGFVTHPGQRSDGAEPRGQSRQRPARMTYDEAEIGVPLQNSCLGDLCHFGLQALREC